MRHLSTLAIAAGVFLLAAQPLAAQTSPSCALIEKVISAAEDFSEFALAGKRRSARETLRDMRRFFANIKPALPAGAAASAEESIEAATAALAADDLPRAALAAIEAYHVLIVALRPRLPTTLDVAMLDYSGFKFHALIADKPIDWQAVTGLVAKSGEETRSVRKRLISNQGLSDLIGTIQEGLSGAAAAKQPKWLESAAQIQLDSVDLLEQLIKNPSPDACI